MTPPGFDFPFASEVWAPIVFSPADAADRTNRYLTTIARLSPGTSFDAGAAAMQTIYARQRAATPDAFRTRHLVVRSFASGMRDEGLLTILLMWQVAAIVVLIVACTNVANLLLAQGAAREREMAVRTALGAGRARLVRQLLAEGLVLALVAVPIALALAAAGFVAIRAAMPPELTRFIPGWENMGVDWRTLAATTVLAAVTAVIFGAIPALRSASPRVGDSLRGSRSVTAGVSRSRLRRALVIAEVAIALPLLVLSGLAVLGAHRFASGPQGYDPDGALRLRMILSEATYPDAPARRQFVNRVLERLSSDARVAEVATTSILPAGNSNQSREVIIDGRPVDPDRPMIANYRAVSPAYLQTLRIPIVDGRGIEAADRDGRELVAVISQSMARRWFPDGDAIGRAVRLGTATDPPRRIVGISGDTIDDWFIHRAVTDGLRAGRPVAVRPGVRRPAPAPGRSVEPHRGRPRGRGRSRPGPADVRGHDDAARRARADDGTALRRRADGGVRGDRAPARGDRALRRDVGVRRPAPARDRHSHGARRRHARRPAPDDRTGRASRARRHASSAWRWRSR